MRSKEAVGDVLWVNTSALQYDKEHYYPHELKKRAAAAK